jgi:hypothetical protein
MGIRKIFQYFQNSCPVSIIKNSSTIAYGVEAKLERLVA